MPFPLPGVLSVGSGVGSDGVGSDGVGSGVGSGGAVVGGGVVLGGAVVLGAWDVGPEGFEVWVGRYLAFLLMLAGSGNRSTFVPSRAAFM